VPAEFFGFRAGNSPRTRGILFRLASIVGCDQKTVSNDLRDANASKNDANASVTDVKREESQKNNDALRAVEVEKPSDFDDFWKTYIVACGVEYATLEFLAGRCDCDFLDSIVREIYARHGQPFPGSPPPAPARASPGSRPSSRPARDQERPVTRPPLRPAGPARGIFRHVVVASQMACQLPRLSMLWPWADRARPPSVGECAGPYSPSCGPRPTLHARSQCERSASPEGRAVR